MDKKELYKEENKRAYSLYLLKKGFKSFEESIDIKNMTYIEFIENLQNSRK